MAGRAVAIVLAAGFSGRMEEFKPLLALGRVTLLERCVALFQEAGIGDVRVVTGHRGAELEPILARLCVRNVVNPRYQEGMFSSVKAGIATVSGGSDPVFVLPVDVPLVRKVTILSLLDAYRETPSDVLYPTFLGRRGHPPLIAARRAAEIAGWQGAGGLRAILSRWEEGARELEVADEHVLHDMDTPEDYRLLQEMAGRLDIPTAEECRVLLEKVFCVGGAVIRHGEAVARVAVALGRALNRAGLSLDIPLLEAAALLHDLAKGQPDHARLGARLLREQGCGGVAGVVASHMEIALREDEAIGEAEILYLADKLVQGERVVSLEERFQGKMERHGADDGALDAIRRRLEVALAIRRRVEELSGKSLDEVVTVG